MVEINKKAPDFTLMGSDKRQHALIDYQGKKVILYFYPKDDTPGCSIEAEGFRDSSESLRDFNAVVLGVSRDSLSSHDKFIEKLDIPFTLLSDEDSRVCELYDVLKEKNLYGKKSIGIQRSTFIIDEEGMVLYENKKVKAEGHAEEVLDFLKSAK